jgi:RNA polymerase sigma factor (sigma-70 family)
VLVRKFSPLVHAIARRVLGPEFRDSWEDASQLAFVKIVTRLNKWDGRCPFCDWLAVVATRRILDFAESVKTSPPTVALPREVIDPRPPPLSPEVTECLERTIASLPSQWRQAFDLTMQGLSREEVAQTLGRSVRTIHYWLAAIHESMNDCIYG